MQGLRVLQLSSCGAGKGGGGGVGGGGELGIGGGGGWGEGKGGRLAGGGRTFPQSRGVDHKLVGLGWNGQCKGLGFRVWGLGFGV